MVAACDEGLVVEQQGGSYLEVGIGGVGLLGRLLSRLIQESSAFVEFRIGIYADGRLYFQLFHGVSFLVLRCKYKKIIVISPFETD